MKQIRYIISILFLCLGFTFCKNESKSTDTVVNTPAVKKGGDVSSLEVLDHDFNIVPEGSKLFLRGFFNNQLVNSAITVDKGSLHVKNGLLTTAQFGLNMNSIAMIMNRNEATETFMKGEKAFDAAKFPEGILKFDECVKAVNDQHATHNLKGSLSIHGKTIPVSTRARIDYTPNNISILSDQIVIKSSDLGISPVDPSQENLYFSLTLNGSIPK